MAHRTCLRRRHQCPGGSGSVPAAFRGSALGKLRGCTVARRLSASTRRIKAGEKDRRGTVFVEFLLDHRRGLGLSFGSAIFG